MRTLTSVMIQRLEERAAPCFARVDRALQANLDAARRGVSPEARTRYVWEALAERHAWEREAYEPTLAELIAVADKLPARAQGLADDAATAILARAESVDAAFRVVAGLLEEPGAGSATHRFGR